MANADLIPVQVAQAQQISTQPGNQATLQARQGKANQPTREAQYIRDTGMGSFGTERAECMTGAIFERDLVRNGVRMNEAKVCLALMDSHAEDEFNNRGNSKIYAPYEEIAAKKGYGSVNIPAAVMVARAINSTVLANQNFAQVSASGTPAASVPKAVLQNGQTVNVYNATALDSGYAMAFSYFNAGILDKLDFTRVYPNATQAQLERSAEACIKDTPGVTLGQCLATGVEYATRSLPSIKARAETARSPR